MNLIILDIRCLKPGQLKSRLTNWTPIKATVKMGTSGTILLTYLEHISSSEMKYLALSTGYRKSLAVLD